LEKEKRDLYLAADMKKKVQDGECIKEISTLPEDDGRK